MSWSPIHARIHTLLKSKVLLPKDTTILIAVSGGQDSLCMAKLLLDLRKQWGWQLAIVHCDHGWRSDSAANAAHVMALAHQWQLPYFGEVAQTLRQTEAAARNWRYGVFADLASRHGYHHIVTGHTATDRAETVLYNLLRGSGADGVQALSWRRPVVRADRTIWVTRPLLQLTREETGIFCQDFDLPVWHDSSNDDLHYRRNRIRQELMPYLKSHFNPNAETTLAQTAEIFTAEVTYLEAQTEQLYTHVVTHIENRWCINRPLFAAAPLALQRRMARRLLQTVLPQQPKFDHIEKLVVLMDGPQRSQTDPFPGGWIARVENDQIILQQ